MGIKVRPNQIWQDQDNAHTLIIIARSMVLPYLIGLCFRFHSVQMKITESQFRKHAYRKVSGQNAARQNATGQNSTISKTDKIPQCRW